ncbi:MAG: hypothetical protein KC656_26525, partial [Myxococcales bacterium]|nr:hypothetical protein [Myxococcales bacterium]
DGERWSELHPDGRRPPPRKYTALAADPVHHTLLLHGGDGAFTERGDTWLWDGLRWTEVTPEAGGPGVRQGHEMVWDPAGQEVVLYGGSRAGVLLDDTWVWDGTAWTEIVLPDGAPRPPALAFHALASSPDGEVLLFGGATPGPRSQATWRWDGAAHTWTDVTPPPEERPPARRFHDLAWDPADQRMVTFGGQVGTARMDDTWAWDGHAWVDVTPTGEVLVGRSGHAVALDPVHDSLLLFGGTDGVGFLGDTWSWTRSGWRAAVTEAGPAPPPRTEHALAPDLVRGELVLFGGQDGSLRDDTWVWDGTTWTEVHPPLPVPAGRWEHPLVWDPVREEIVLFGGRGTTGVLDDTWVWDGSAWTELTPDERPPARSEHAMFWDPHRLEVVVHGGLSADARLDDTWAWNGDTWVQLTTTGDRPVTRDRHAIAWDPSRQQHLLTGRAAGAQRDVEHWWWDGRDASWYEGASGGTVSTPREDHTLTADPVHAGVLQVGGYDGSRRPDAWRVRSGGPLRPAQHFEVDQVDAGVPDAIVTSLTARWIGGGEGFPTTGPTEGARLHLWDGIAWVPGPAHDSGSAAPEELCWSVRRADDQPAQPDCTVETDPVLLD